MKDAFSLRSRHERKLGQGEEHEDSHVLGPCSFASAISPNMIPRLALFLDPAGILYRLLSDLRYMPEVGLIRGGPIPLYAQEQTYSIKTHSKFILPALGDETGVFWRRLRASFAPYQW
ncbi:hypothetical protein LshimejAT787_1201010 [Lyophyllum shimeji]|uniref:Uncharacterized protein n=1 Tax=Lyophyllum shimeji TaxID=47721 RepID=A0A9P3PTN5_LYOSH|nr:hypothetical protein LshimejAT787_1201010 [Lyophyllum shimeji]